MIIKRQTGTQIHVPVLPTEVLDYLNISTDGVYLDGTVGLGGHATLILDQLSP
ncbi:MAG: 16S rRNA (cytosine(1402)-N(4))-methyltransferase, partial [Candidatus Marinimicrobia bacterium]|nr:16S rRNA (cytosine(1402)-N(4))-methyltransferase [Candidatus Neomarinimicrobiota bacterium]